MNTPKDELPYSHPLGGLSEDGTIPKKELLFENTDAMEDFLQHNRIFINPFMGTTCHSDSYGTVVDFAALDKALAVLNEHYQPVAKDWMKHLKYWLGNSNMQPPLRLVALTIARKYGVDIPKESAKVSA